MRILISAATLFLLCAATAAAIDCTDDDESDLPPTPIIINFENGSYRLTGAESPVTFDFYGTGDSLRMGWTAADTDQAFLCLDRNGSGTIENGTEFFGNATPLSGGRRAGNGFKALLAFDDNHDLLIDAQDAIWTELLLWRDRNHDAVSQFEEISHLDTSGVTAISLEYHWTGRVDPTGNALRYQSKVWIAEADKRATPRPLYDVYFVSLM
ncbi:MAG TPA: hypothetical protein VE974_03085 [Thermoanaerobaculia bacterium]|nr:hypothetical protein [Thermoanaerobaculia bacterium]